MLGERRRIRVVACERGDLATIAGETGVDYSPSRTSLRLVLRLRKPRPKVPLRFSLGGGASSRARGLTEREPRRLDWEAVALPLRFCCE